MFVVTGLFEGIDRDLHRRAGHIGGGDSVEQRSVMCPQIRQRDTSAGHARDISLCGVLQGDGQGGSRCGRRHRRNAQPAQANTGDGAPDLIVLRNRRIQPAFGIDRGTGMRHQGRAAHPHLIETGERVVHPQTGLLGHPANRDTRPDGSVRIGQSHQERVVALFGPVHHQPCEDDAEPRDTLHGRWCGGRHEFDRRIGGGMDDETAAVGRIVGGRGLQVG